MPYFVFRIDHALARTCLASFDDYRAARAAVRARRAEDDALPAESFRMVFAEDEFQAEQLLAMPRTRTPSEDD